MSDYLKDLLVEHLKEQAYPVFSFEEKVIPAASIWTASRAWVHFFRSQKITKGQRVVVKLTDSPAFLAVLVAGIWEHLCLCILPPNEEVDDKVIFFDAICSISNDSSASYNITSNDLLNPDAPHFKARLCKLPLYPDHQFILRSSGTTSNGRWSVLTKTSVESVLKSHLEELDFTDEEIVLSVLPWHHCFGLILDLLPALINNVELHRLGDGGKDLPALRSKINELESVRLNGVPLHFKRIAAISPEILSKIHDGIVGGAAIPKELAEILTGSNLRVGYGQTEASPGISLGKKGEFQENCLGYPLGCEIIIDEKHQLHFKGPNRFAGYWTSQGFEKVTGSYIATGDLVHQNKEGFLRFKGRVDDRIKLLNGREIYPLELESKLRRLLPERTDVVVLSINSGYISIALYAENNDQMHIENMIRDRLGKLSKFVKHLAYIDQTDWKKTPKGEIDRKHLNKVLRTAVPL